ncbi:MAG: GNAT family N-acyltransferase [Candidatus Binatia bacterium]
MESWRLCFEVAGPHRREAILQLRQAVYGDELGYGPRAVEWGPIDERAIHLLAMSEAGEAVGMIRLLGPTGRPFEMETSLDLTPFLRPGHPPGETTRLCIAAPFRRITRAMQVYLGLIRLLYDVCQMQNIDDIFICAVPTVQKMYESILFEALTPPNIPYLPFGGVPHLLMRLHMVDLPARYAAANHLLNAAFAAPAGEDTSAR